jgi:hypothetical protein
MKLFDLCELAEASGGEYVLGMKDLHTDSCYLVYGILRPGEEGRLVRPGVGYEEILCAVDGELLLQGKQGKVPLAGSHAVHVTEHESYHLSNPTERPVVYVIAGGLRRNRP